ncbi:oxidoreductase [Micromonospora sicca]|uniref:Oxidoreductase n=1 Tax=Micromonospora sicca TaxID=2202420 RepID=A0A317DHE8_9ACTN|nr:SDR family oxidoreductase [Micromonospora sp. 4G51]PWR13610.1 oxidoreductase [Micromonospora sp. 4G51]
MSTFVITGGSAGIGFGIARRLGRDGHELVLVARGEDRLAEAERRLREEGVSCRSAALDVRDAEAVTALINRLPTVDGVVNNAAGNFACPTVDLSPNGFRAVVEISLYGTFFLSQALARRLITEGRPGVILNIVATYAWTGAPAVAHSAAAKAAMLAFTKSVAREWGPHGIRVNALAPGFVPTSEATANILSDDSAQAAMLDLIPLGRFGDVDDISESAAFLLSERAAYVTGAVLTVDGGRSLGVAMHRAKHG